jgi:Spy/CpxP family protein refolding chaperone
MILHPFRFAALAGALLLIITAGLSAQSPEQGFPRSQRTKGLGLNLSVAQKAQVKAIRDHHQAALQAKGIAVADARKALREAMVKPETDTATLKRLHEQASLAQFERMLEGRSVRLEILPLLTPDQKAKLEQRQGALGRNDRKGRGFGMHRGERSWMQPS